MSAKVQEAVDAVWADYDKDGDDRLNRAEAEAFYTELSLNNPELTGLPAFDIFYTEADQNKDGHLTKEEVVAFHINYLKP